MQFGISAVYAVMGSMIIPTQPPSTVDLDVPRYMGRWYGIADTTPSYSECNCTTADYALVGNVVTVINSCDGERIEGTASPANEPGQFLLDFSSIPGIAQGSYWVVDVADDYETYAVVSTPDWDPIFILSRDPKFGELSAYEELLDRLEVRGFNITGLVKVGQVGCQYPTVSVP